MVLKVDANISRESFVVKLNYWERFLLGVKKLVAIDLTILIIFLSHVNLQL